MQSELSLFVYGSLSEGMVHFNLISQYIVEKQNAWTKGQAYRLPSGYPVLLSQAHVDPNAAELDRVGGQYVKLEAPELVFNLLNEFHGVSVMAPEKSLFFKEAVKVETECGENRDAFVFAMNKAKLPKGSMRIAQGDWQSNMKEVPTLPSQLTERQAAYIKKLKGSSGREIVPIDLNLYRELMKLELIVDKGRRLALSKLGIEVARYLS